MNIAVAQSGGPTCAINSSLLGVLKEGLKHKEIKTIYGAINGIVGVINNDFADLTQAAKDFPDIDLMRQTPSSLLGSCRYKLPDPEKDPSAYETIAQNLEKNDIGAFFYIGGNDSMDTTNKLSAYMKKTGRNIKVIGVPKTVDNDLCETDHTPGFGSAAKYVATTVSEVARDSLVYSIPNVTIIEIMGRNAGWLAASACVARANGETAPHLIYLPEAEFSKAKFLADVNAALKQYLSVVVVVSEGIQLDGTVTEGKVDAFGHGALAGIGKELEAVVTSEIGCKCRAIELSVIQRCASHISSLTDIEESEEVGKAAVRAMLAGETGKMMAFKRIMNDPYTVAIEPVDACLVANNEKKFPLEWITEGGNNVKDDALAYFLPLVKGEQVLKTVNGLPAFYRTFNKQ